MGVPPAEGADSAIDGADRGELGQDGSKRGETVALEVRAAVGRPGEGAVGLHAEGGTVRIVEPGADLVLEPDRHLCDLYGRVPPAGGLM